MWATLSWLGNYWTVLIWAVPFLIVFAFVWHLLGWRFALPVGFVLAALVIFLLGRKIERDSNRKRVQDIGEKRKKAHEKIDSRNTDRISVLDRLRRGNF